MAFPTSAVLPRVVPFVLFVLLTALQGQFGVQSHYWIYALKTLLVGGIVIFLAPKVMEMRLSFSWEAVWIGVGIFLVWVFADPYYPKVDELWARISGKPMVATHIWNPFADCSVAMAWLAVGFRFVGSVCVVPLVEEVFYRSFFYRFIIREKFLEVPLTRFSAVHFCIVSVVFGLVHQQWVAGIFCGMAYQWLVIRKGRLGDAILAHAITNLLLGAWVVCFRAWNFW